MYDDFTGRVAKARRMEQPRVKEIAQGRIWMGRKATTLGLTDRVATLDETIEAAKRAAGIRPGRRVRIVEYPERHFFTFGAGLTPDLRVSRGGGISAIAPRTLEAGVVQQILDHPGLPLLLAPSAALPDEQEPVR
jgi:ClpP class serine protease